jgi:ABC-2 type transport system permease protein
MLEKAANLKAAPKLATKQGPLNRLANIYYLTIKELRSIRADYMILILVIYTFTFAVYTVATGVSTNPEDLTVGIVDEDHSNLSREFREALSRPPLFKRAVLINANEIDPIMNAGRMIFVLEIPARFEQDLLTGRTASLQLNIDATAMAPAGNGAIYIQATTMQEVTNFLAGREMTPPAAVNVVIRTKFNPNLYSAWFSSVMQVVNNITMLAVILTGAALIREREHGTIEHLLVMPVVPPEIM